MIQFLLHRHIHHSSLHKQHLENLRWDQLEIQVDLERRDNVIMHLRNLVETWVANFDSLSGTEIIVTSIKLLAINAKASVR